MRTRRSISGGVVIIDGVALKHWSSTQSSVALSSGEAEYTALVKAATEGIGIQALAADMGWAFKLEVLVDSSTAKSIASRSGIGKVRHLNVKTLWVQEAVKGSKFRIVKVRGDRNLADLLTKSQGMKDFGYALADMGANAIKREDS